MYGPVVPLQPLNVNDSLNPKVPPPHDILNGTPICFSLTSFNSLGIISSKFSMVINNLPLTKNLSFPNLYSLWSNHFLFS